MKRKVWMGEVVGRLHMFNATSKDLAKECGYTAPYIYMLLIGKKKGTAFTIQRIFQSLENLERKKSNSSMEGIK